MKVKKLRNSSLNEILSSQILPGSRLSKIAHLNTKASSMAGNAHLLPFTNS